MVKVSSKSTSYKHVTTATKKFAVSAKAHQPAKVVAPKVQHAVYSLNLAGGKKYVGKTDNIDKRLADHFSGNGSQWTQKHKPVSVNHIQVCRTSATQAKAETIVYTKMRDYHGMSKVRGAGHTTSK
jgi:predicted GIY-YIG superfamily endonuclease